jgi:hypothetical protein
MIIIGCDYVATVFILSCRNPALSKTDQTHDHENPAPRARGA